MWVAMHKCMEAKLAISLYSYLYLKNAVSFLLSPVFSSTKSEKKKVEQVLSGTEGGARESGRWPKQCIHM
jgi:hypothetical protein